MSIYQLQTPCWELTDPADDERTPHFDTEADAQGALKEIRDEDPGSKASIRRLEEPCWLITCNGACETTLDEEGECYTYHSPSHAVAVEIVKDYEWVLLPDPLTPMTMLVYCPDDVPEGDEVPAPPLSAAEQEAAGQLRIPGVLA